MKVSLYVNDFVVILLLYYRSFIDMADLIKSTCLELCVLSEKWGYVYLISFFSHSTSPNYLNAL